MGEAGGGQGSGTYWFPWACRL